MTEAQIDPFPVAELQNRYGIGKQAVYNRLEALGIKPTKEGNRSFINSEQLLSLDELHNHLQAGGTMADFHPKTESTISPLRTVDLLDTTLEARSSSISELVALVEAITSLSFANACHLKPADPLLHYKELEQAAASGWVLTSAEVKQLIGISPRTKKGDRTFKRGAFIFVKAENIGNQSGWRVTKELSQP